MKIEQFYPSKILQFCPYCGTPNIEWNDTGNCMLCNQCKQSFYINAAAAVVALIYNDNGHLLFTTRQRDPHKDMLDLPGGFVDHGETSENAIIREVKEELNLDIVSCKYMHSMPNRYLYKGIVYFTLDLVYQCKVVNFNKIEAADDVSGYQFISLDTIENQSIGLESIQQIVNNLKHQSASHK